MNKLPQNSANPLFYCAHCKQDVKNNCHEYFNADSGKYTRTCKLCGNIIVSMKIGRNAPCPCGSGKKYKKCHLIKIKNESTR